MCFSTRTRRYKRKCRSFEKAYSIKRSTEEAFAVSLLTGLNDFRKEGTLCDVTLKVGKRTIRAHKIVIFASSPYFTAMFSESNQQEVFINDVDADSLELLIDYMYTGMLNIEFNNVKDILLAASFLKITGAEELCRKFMENGLNMANCIEYLLLARKCSIESLMELSYQTALLNLHHITSQNEYLQLEFEDMKQITQRLKKTAYPEDLIYSFVMRWIKDCYETRINFMEDLLELMNPSLISTHLLHPPEIVGISNPVFTAWAGRVTVADDQNAPGERALASRVFKLLFLEAIKTHIVFLIYIIFIFYIAEVE